MINREIQRKVQTMILSCQHIHKAFIEDVVLNDITFTINENEKVAIVGINGAGKSTLFRIITGEMEADSGQIVIANRIEPGYLKQEAMPIGSGSLFETMLEAHPILLALESKMHDLEEQLLHYATPTTTESEEALISLNHDYATTRHDYEVLDGYSFRSRAKGILLGLGFEERDLSASVSVLSGGQKTRLALAQLLLQQPQLLLLDEPTNHLDIPAIMWLEGFLSAYKGTLLLISHDRYFIDRVALRVIEIEHGMSNDFNGNYSFYTHHKELNRNIAEKHYDDQQKMIQKQEEVIRKLKSFNREKSIKRAQSREKALDKIQRVDKPLTLHDSMHFTLKPHTESGNDVLTVRNLKKAFDELLLFDNLDLDIKKGERIGLIGENGTGKSTLFKILTHGTSDSTVTQDKGTVTLGSKVKIGYYDQEHAQLNSSKTLFEEISDTYPKLTQTEIRNTLAAFLFTGDEVFKTINTLSGGERGRLTLAKLLLSESNFLILDEPTNHLDMISKSILENALCHYTGTLFFISHDRYFVNQVATRVLELDNKRITSYLGNYDFYLEKKKSQSDTLIDSSNENLETMASTNSQTKEDWLREKELKTQRTRLERQLSQAETKIHELESRIEVIDSELCLESVYSDHEKALAYTLEKETCQEELEKLYEVWTLCHEELEAF